MKVAREFIFDPGLVLYLPLYKLDGSSFMSKDAYGHLNTVTGALWTPEGYTFDGVDDRINCGNPIAFDFTTELTAMAWVKFKTQSSGYKYVIAKHNAFMVLVVPDGVDGLIYLFGLNNTPYSRGAATINPNVFYHIVISTPDGTVDNASFYLNGQKLTTTVLASGSTGTNTNSLFLGARDTDWGWSDIVLGEVRLYHRALTPLEIQHNYLASKWRYR